MKRKKTYETITTDDMREEVDDIEKRMQSIDSDIFASSQDAELYSMMKMLDTSERRLLIVFSQLDSSVIKTAKYFNVDRRTVTNRIKEIRQKLTGNYDTTTDQPSLFDSE